MKADFFTFERLILAVGILIGLVMSVYIANTLYLNKESLSDSLYDAAATDATDFIVNAFRYVAVPSTVTTALTVFPDVSIHQFDQLANSFVQRSVTTLLTYAPHVTDISSFEAEASKMYNRNIELFTLNDSNAATDEAWPALFIHPRQDELIGADISTENVRAQAIERMLHTQNASILGTVELRSTETIGLLTLQPVIDASTTTGCVIRVFQASDFLGANRIEQLLSLYNIQDLEVDLNLYGEEETILDVNPNVALAGATGLIEERVDILDNVQIIVRVP